jgi:hypothetical protein
MTMLRFAIFTMICGLSACTSPQTASPPALALGMIMAPSPPYAEMVGTPEVNAPIETSFVTYFSYSYTDPNGNRQTMHALIGPNEGERVPAKATLDGNGHLFIYSGFGYLSTFRSSPTSPEESGQPKDAQDAALAPATTQPSMSRPYLRTKRVRLTGDGTAYAAQVTDAEDHGYYIHGVTFHACSAHDQTKVKNWTQAAKLKWFTSIDDGDDFSNEGDYTQVANADRKAFADYLRQFTTPLGLIDP